MGSLLPSPLNSGWLLNFSKWALCANVTKFEGERAEKIFSAHCLTIGQTKYLFKDHLSTGERTNTRAVQLITANRCCAPV